MTHVKRLYIGTGCTTVILECGHVQHVDGWYSTLRPGTAYDCPDGSRKWAPLSDDRGASR